MKFRRNSVAPKPTQRAIRAANKVPHNPKNSKSAKTAAGLDLTQSNRTTFLTHELADIK